MYFGMKADLKARKEVNEFRNWYQCTRLCESCLAEKPAKKNNPGMDFRNLQAEAPYFYTRLSHEQFLKFDNAPPWSCVPGFRIETVSLDFMHNVYLGLGKDVVSSSLGMFLLAGVYDKYGRTAEEQLQGVWEQMRSDCHRHGCLT
ncbi:nipblb [Symbiodinium sp. CCMP2456]|nr:nipblb [Symbiodinium sp. CCMP2456]